MVWHLRSSWILRTAISTILITYYKFYHKAGNSVRHTRLMMDLNELSSASNLMDKSNWRTSAMPARAYQK